MLTTGSSFTLHPTAQAAPAATMAPAEPEAKHRFSFDDLLDIVNPLQHLPIIGTLYRAITGDKIGTPEKLVGDAVYGGPWGLVSSLADTAFEKATGKNFGDTVLGLVTGKHDAPPQAVAAAEPPQATATAESDTAQRALLAYRRSLHAQHPSAFGLF